jgi:hypothetical protein
MEVIVLWSDFYRLIFHFYVLEAGRNICGTLSFSEEEATRE